MLLGQMSPGTLGRWGASTELDRVWVVLIGVVNCKRSRNWAVLGGCVGQVPCELNHSTDEMGKSSSSPFGMSHEIGSGIGLQREALARA